MFDANHRLLSRRAFTPFLIALACAVHGQPTVADDASAPPISPPPVSLPPVVISATRIPTPETQLGSSVTVITGEEIQRKQERTLPDVLQDVPGLTIVQTGGPGGFTSVFMRGTNANHTKVLIDGVDAGDPSSTAGAFDFSQILASDIERVEVLRGPQSGLYGSDAIGGVISITTKQGSGPPRVTASVEGGSFGTFNQTAGVSGSASRFNYNFDFSHFHSADTPVTPSGLVPPGRPVNPDYYDNLTFATRLGARVTDDFDLGLVARLVDTTLRSTSDDFLGPEAIPSDSDSLEFFSRATAHLVMFDGAFDQTIGLAYTDYVRQIADPNYTPVSPGFYRGDRVKLDYQGNIHLMQGQILTIGAEHQLDEINDSGPVQGQMANDAVYLQLQSSFGERFFNTTSVRYDNNDRFGGKATFRVAPAFLIPETSTKFKASVGTGFKAPTLDEMFDSFPEFGFFANPYLKPETSVGYDIGFEQSVLNERVSFGATYFHNNITNLISINEAGTTYANIGQATTQGAEIFVAYKPVTAVALRADYTYTNAVDDVLHQELLRRPRDKASLNATWQVSEAASVSATVLYIGPWVDINRSGSVSGLIAKGYTLVNLAGSYDLGHGLTAYARINNLLDQHYQDPTGFLHPGLGIFAGLRIVFDTPG
jgi:vitamin B12 transporter